MRYFLCRTKIHSDKLVGDMMDLCSGQMLKVDLSEFELKPTRVYRVSIIDEENWRFEEISPPPLEDLPEYIRHVRTLITNSVWQ